MAINTTAGTSAPAKMVTTEIIIVSTHSICGSKWIPIDMGVSRCTKKPKNELFLAFLALGPDDRSSVAFFSNGDGFRANLSG